MKNECHPVPAQKKEHREACSPPKEACYSYTIPAVRSTPRQKTSSPPPVNTQKLHSFSQKKAPSSETTSRATPVKLMEFLITTMNCNAHNPYLGRKRRIFSGHGTKTLPCCIKHEYEIDTARMPCTLCKEAKAEYNRNIHKHYNEYAEQKIFEVQIEREMAPGIKNRENELKINFNKFLNGQSVNLETLSLRLFEIPVFDPSESDLPEWRWKIINDLRDECHA